MPVFRALLLIQFFVLCLIFSKLKTCRHFLWQVWHIWKGEDINIFQSLWWTGCVTRNGGQPQSLRTRPNPWSQKNYCRFPLPLILRIATIIAASSHTPITPWPHLSVLVSRVYLTLKESYAWEPKVCVLFISSWIRHLLKDFQFQVSS